MQAKPELQPELLLINQSKLFLTVAFVLCMPNGMPYCKRKKHHSMKWLQGKGFGDIHVYKRQMQATKNPFKMKGHFFKMEGLAILKFRILLSSGKVW